MFWETFGVLIPAIRNPITGFFLNGELAVSIFFVLSGDALSSAYFAGKGEAAVAKLAIKRYSRLTIPILFTCIIIFLLCKLGLQSPMAAGNIVHRPDWFGKFLRIPITPIYFTKYSLLGVYMHSDYITSVDPFLWTMQAEIVGSIIVFLVLLTFSYFKYAWLLLFIIATPLLADQYMQHYSCFLFGVAFSAARANGAFERLKSNKMFTLISWLAIFVLGAGQGLLAWKGKLPHASSTIAIMLVFFIFSNRALCGFFSHKVSRFLGKISFPIYLMQFPVLISFTSMSIVYLGGRGLLNPGVDLAIASSSVILSMVAAMIFDPIEILTKWVGDMIVKFLVKTPAAGAA